MTGSARMIRGNAANLVTVYCDACGPTGSELGVADNATQARQQLRAQGWAVGVERPGVIRRLDFCPLHKGRRTP